MATIIKASRIKDLTLDRRFYAMGNCGAALIEGHCLNCDTGCGTEAWGKLSNDDPIAMYSEPKDCTRIIFATHPQKLMSYVAIPAIFSVVYFCKKCAYSTNVDQLLLNTINSCGPPREWISGNNSELDPKRGYFLTWWPINRNLFPEWPFAGQFNRSMFESIVDKLAAIPSNMFQLEQPKKLVA